MTHRTVTVLDIANAITKLGHARALCDAAIATLAVYRDLGESRVREVSVPDDVCYALGAMLSEIEKIAAQDTISMRRPEPDAHRGPEPEIDRVIRSLGGDAVLDVNGKPLERGKWAIDVPSGDAVQVIDGGTSMDGIGELVTVVFDGNIVSDTVHAHDLRMLTEANEEADR